MPTNVDTDPPTGTDDVGTEVGSVGATVVPEDVGVGTVVFDDVVVGAGSVSTGGVVVIRGGTLGGAGSSPLQPATTAATANVAAQILRLTGIP